VAAGRPYEQRAPPGRNARGRRPSCRWTGSSSSTAPKRMVLAAPGVDALPDEQPLAGLHEREPPRLENKRLGAPRGLQPPLELTVLGLESANLLAARRERVARVQVGPERPEVEERDQD